VNFVVRSTDGAVEDLRQLHAWIVNQRSEQAANRWLANLLRALSGLQTLPRRHPRAREADQFREVVLRQMVSAGSGCSMSSRMPRSWCYTRGMPAGMTSDQTRHPAGRRMCASLPV
jgi:plasmid stabilization system protein ParE